MSRALAARTVLVALGLSAAARASAHDAEGPAGPARGAPMKIELGPAPSPTPEQAAERRQKFDAKGRIFVLGELSRARRTIVRSDGTPITDDETGLDLSLPSARASLLYQSPLDWLSSEIEVEFAEGVDLKDAYVRAKGKRLRGTFGQFKMPGSVIESESEVDLPTIRRGLVHELLTEYLDVFGRRPGLALEWRGPGSFEPRITLGAFQASVLVDESSGRRQTDLVNGVGMDAQSLVARVQGEFGPLGVGVFYEDRVGSPRLGATERYWTAGLDLALDEEFACSGLRLWLDAIAGASFQEHEDKQDDGEDATFVSGRAVGAYRLGGIRKNDGYFEPFGFVGVFDPDAEVTADLAWEAGAGINVGYWRRFSVGLEGEVWRADRNFPSSYFLGRDPDRLSLLLQLAVIF